MQSANKQQQDDEKLAAKTSSHKKRQQTQSFLQQSNGWTLASPCKQVVSLNQPASVLKAHKQASSTTSYPDMTHLPMSPTLKQFKDHHKNNAANNDNQQQNQQQFSETSQTQEHKMRSKSKNCNIQKMHHKYQLQTVKTLSFKQSTTTSVDKQVTSSPIEQKNKVASSRMIGHNNSVILIPSKRTQKNNVASTNNGLLQQHSHSHQQQQLMQQSQKNAVVKSQGGGLLSARAICRQLVIETGSVGPQHSPIKEEDIPMSADIIKSLESAHSAASFTWHVKQRADDHLQSQSCSKTRTVVVQQASFQPQNNASNQKVNKKMMMMVMPKQKTTPREIVRQSDSTTNKSQSFCSSQVTSSKVTPGLAVPRALPTQSNTHHRKTLSHAFMSMSMIAGKVGAANGSGGGRNPTLLHSSQANSLILTSQQRHTISHAANQSASVYHATPKSALSTRPSLLLQSHHQVPSKTLHLKQKQSSSKRTKSKNPTTTTYLIQNQDNSSHSVLNEDNSRSNNNIEVNYATMQPSDLNNTAATIIQKTTTSQCKRRETISIVSSKQRSESLLQVNNKMANMSSSSPKPVSKQISNTSRAQAPSQICKRQKDIGDGQIKPKQMNSYKTKASPLVSANKTMLVLKNPEDQTPVLFKQSRGGTQSVLGSSTRNLMNCKKLILDKKQLSSTIMTPSAANQSRNTNGSLGIMSLTQQPQQQHHHPFRKSMNTGRLQPKKRQDMGVVKGTATGKKKKQQTIVKEYVEEAQTSNEVDLGQINQNKDRGEATTIPGHGVENYLEDGSSKQQIQLQRLQQLHLPATDSSDSDIHRTFETEDRSPMSSVPQVKICLTSFQEKSFAVENDAPTNNDNSSKNNKNQNDHETKGDNSQGFDKKANQAMLNVKSNESSFDQHMHQLEQHRFKLPQSNKQEKSVNNGGVSLTFGNYMRQTDPFQQGGGSMIKDGQTGEHQQLPRRDEMDTSAIPAEDCGTQKVSNIKILEQSNTQRSKQHLMSPISTTSRKATTKLFHQRLQSLCLSPDARDSIDDIVPTFSASLTHSARKSAQKNGKNPVLRSDKKCPPRNEDDQIVLDLSIAAQKRKSQKFNRSATKYESISMFKSSVSKNRLYLNSTKNAPAVKTEISPLKYFHDRYDHQQQNTSKNNPQQPNLNNCEIGIDDQTTEESKNYIDSQQKIRGVNHRAQVFQVQSPNRTMAKRESFAKTARDNKRHKYDKAQTMAPQDQRFFFGIAEDAEDVEDTQQSPTTNQVKKKDIFEAPYQDAAPNRNSLGLGKLIESAKSSLQPTNLRNNLNPMFESIKKSFQSMIGSSTTQGKKEESQEYNRRGTDKIVIEESKSNVQLVAFSDLNCESLQQLKTGKDRLLFHHSEASAWKPGRGQQATKEGGGKQEGTEQQSMQIMSEPAAKGRRYTHVGGTSYMTTDYDDTNNYLQQQTYEQSKDDDKNLLPVLSMSMKKLKSQPRAAPLTSRKDHVPFFKEQNNNGDEGSSMSFNPMGAPSDCLIEFGHLLTQQEKLEILSYTEVFFVGSSQAKALRKTQLQNNSVSQRDRHRSNASRSPASAIPTQSSNHIRGKTSTTKSTLLHGNSLSQSRGNKDLLNAIYGSNHPSNQRNAVASRRRNVNFVHNHGYDTATGFYQVISGDHLDFRYETLQELGRGTFGQVIRCKDHKTGKSVAIKLSKNLSYAGLENCMREVRLLQQANSVLSQHSERIVALYDKFRFRQHMCLVFEILEGCDLYKEIKETQMQGLKDIDQLKKVVQQVVQGLCHLKECGIVHCDLKPENLIYSSQTRDQVKIVDLGSACSRTEKGYPYVCSRYYRAPEIVLNRRADYDFSVDMWSLGCIVAELYNGLPLFLASSQNELIQFHSLYCGNFDRDEVLTYDDYRQFLDLNTPSGIPAPIAEVKPKYASVKPKVESSIIREVLCRKKRTKNGDGLNLELTDDEVLGLVSQDERLMIDFIVSCLQLKPYERMTCENALMHPFIAR